MAWAKSGIAFSYYSQGRRFVKGSFVVFSAASVLKGLADPRKDF
jgi:hypothetical protein